MRLAAISDIHGNITAFEAIVADLRRQAPDAIVCLGDISLRGPRPHECIQLLKELKPLVTLRGNHDQCLGDEDWAPRNFKEASDLDILHYHQSQVSEADRDWLLSLPILETLTLEGVQTELFHAAPTSMYAITWPWAPLDDLCQLRADAATRLVLFGHVHHGFIRQARGRLVVNTGSVGMPFDGDRRASYALIDVEAGNISAQLRRVDFDVEQAAGLAHDVMPHAWIFETAVRTGLYPYTPDQVQPG